MSDYFTLLNASVSFDIDLSALEKNYFKLQQQLHPDRFANKPEAERTKALQQSMTVNEAYNTLKDPFKRGEYLLSLQGIIVKEGQHNVKPSQEVLMAMMELREELEEANSADAIQQIAGNIEQEKQELLASISERFAKQDYQQAAQEVIHLRYLDKAQEEIKLKRRSLKAA